MPEFRSYPDREMMFIDLAQAIAGELNTCLAAHDHASLAVPGGTTPGPLFDVLSAADLDWSRVHVVLTDERWVGTGSDRSNTKLLHERLLVNRAKDAVLVPMVSDAATPEEGVAALSKGLDGELPLSILLTGMGTDCHTASLFPGADRLADALAPNAPPLMAINAPGAPEPRITLTAPVLDGALSKHVLIVGEEKKAAYETALRSAAEDAPITAIWDGGTVHWAP